MRIHFIAIGGAAMHNLAIALFKNGHEVSGSDDEIYEPSRSRLEKQGLLPTNEGWRPEIITEEIDAIILGMHAKKDNPELLKAQELGIKIHSYPSFVAAHSTEKKRVVIAGSHGKTTTTSIVMHVLKELNVDFDYLVGSQIEGFDTMVKLSNAPVIVLEGDEYLSSPIDSRPKMLHYKPHISVITGIAWDHVNVFPTFEEYIKQFDLFIQSHEEDSIIYCYSEDNKLNKISQKYSNIKKYNEISVDTNRQVKVGDSLYSIPLIGRHNLQNIDAAYHICQNLGISDMEFYQALSSFKGAKRRLQLIKNSDKLKVYLDFAHSPSKVNATVKGIREWYPSAKIFAFYELHTYSSFQPKFLKHYKGSLDMTDYACVLYNEKTLKIKNRKPPKDSDIKSSFDRQDIEVITDKATLESVYSDICDNESGVVLIMTSGNFFGLV